MHRAWLVAGVTFLVLLASVAFRSSRGWTTNGIISSHFVPAAHDHGMAATMAAGLLAVVGVFGIVGTIASGWLTDRVDPRLLLAVHYGLRGLALLAVVALFGLDRVATVPPTVVLCRAAFGPECGGIVFGCARRTRVGRCCSCGAGAACGAPVTGAA